MAQIPDITTTPITHGWSLKEVDFLLISYLSWFVLSIEELFEPRLCPF
jgi:hypothetical protein